MANKQELIDICGRLNITVAETMTISDLRRLISEDLQDGASERETELLSLRREMEELKRLIEFSVREKTKVFKAPVRRVCGVRLFQSPL